VPPRLAVALACLAAAGAAAGCGSVARNAAEGSASSGQQLFTSKCGNCHTLAAAGTQGTIGPNLDDAFRVDRRDHGYDESTIRDVVRGQIAYPTSEPPTGDPGMPANLVTGQDADDVAAYVASVAGLPVKGGGAPVQQATDGKTIFTQQCGSCHTLADAGTSGTIGPNLDQLKPSLQAAIKQVTNGGGGMPAFKDQLSEQQIEAVAKYVSENAGK
jgi:cbb3-type cytochrome c oxidase subunit III